MAADRTVGLISDDQSNRDDFQRGQRGEPQGKRIGPGNESVEKQRREEGGQRDGGDLERISLPRLQKFYQYVVLLQLLFLPVPRVDVQTHAGSQ